MAEHDRSPDEHQQNDQRDEAGDTSGGKDTSPDDASDDGDGDGEDGDDEEKKQEEHDEAQRQKARPWVRLGLVVAAVGIVAGGFYLWWSTRNIETTDDAYTAGRVINIEPHVAGYVVELLVNDNEFVHEGQVLARIDPRNYQAAVDSAQAQVDQAQGALEGAKFQAEVSKQTFPAMLKQAMGQLEQARGRAFQAETDYRRQHSVARAATSQQAIDMSTAALQAAQGQVTLAEAQVQQATPVKPNIAVTRTRITQQQGQLEMAQAQLTTARLNLEWSVIRAPHDGWIAQRNIERGGYVNVGQQLFAVVQPDIWITANFKETQLTRMRPGQLVDINVDAYPGLKLHGHVDSIQLGSGPVFSAFPPENATGNFVKIVQRVPVKIRIDSGLDPDLPVPIGLSAEPTVHIGSSASAG